jgi:hypothetical protein
VKGKYRCAALKRQQANSLYPKIGDRTRFGKLALSVGFCGRGQPLSLTLSFGEIPWFDNTALRLVEKYVIFSMPNMSFQAMGSYATNRSAVISPIHQATEFRQTTM